MKKKRKGHTSHSIALFSVNKYILNKYTHTLMIVIEQGKL